VIARAPGKIVLSGAYSVLEGAPAIVSAVDRYVVADARRVAEWVTPEVLAAHLRTRPWFDASALRESDRKIGLGSSAAILVASLAADVLDSGECVDQDGLADAIVHRALSAHAAVQPLGSGADVIASCHGSTRSISRTSGVLTHQDVQLPPDLCIEAWSAPHSQSTHRMLETLLEFRKAQPRLYARHIQDQATAALQALDALQSSNAIQFVSSLGAQKNALELLGSDAGMPIVTDDLKVLANEAAKESAVVLPAGAGGGDVAIFAGPRRPSSELCQLMAQYRYVRLALTLGARGVHGLDKEC
jgi:phosphomevalonate kinase